MKKVEAIIKPERLDRVKNALADAGLVGLNVAQVTGHGTDQGVVTPGPRGVGSSVVDMVPKMRLELVVTDENTEKAVDIIRQNARTGDVGDGRIFITRVSRAIRVRTGEEGDQAL